MIGQSVTRVDAFGKVTGATLYPGDVVIPGMLQMKILFAGRPHARLKRIDVSKAESLKGVVAVLTAKDVPNNEYGLIMPDQPVLVGPGSDKVGGGTARFIGDQVALVIAESEKIAARARDLIELEWEHLPAVFDPREAMKDSAPRLFPEKESNVLIHYRIRHGDVDAAFSSAAVIVEGTYHTPCQEHAFLQPEAGLGYIDEEGRVTVQVAGQWAHEDQEQIAHALKLPLEKVRVIYPAIGGAFGGREDMSVQIVLALAAWKLKRPVKIIWSREESIIGHHKRHPFYIKCKWAADKDGKLLASENEVISDAGAYAYTSTKVLGNATLMVTGPYEIPNVKVDSYTVLTNNIPGGAFRGFGGPQGAFAAESQMDKLAAKLGLDPVEIRARNTIREGSILSVGTPLPKGVSMPQVMEKGAEEAGWKKVEGKWNKPKLADSKSQIADGKSPSAIRHSPSAKCGIGFAMGYKNVGFSFGFPEQSWATIKIEGKDEIDRVTVYQAGADCGQGAHTVFAQMAAEASGVSLDKIQLVMSDTATSQTSGSASASRLTFMAGNAIKGAAELALKKWKDEERPAMATYQYRPPKTTPLDHETGKSEPNFSYGYIAEAVEVEVDTETGHIRVINVIVADDVGHAVNPQQVQGQIEGAIVQAQGYAVLENFVHQNGYVQTPYLSNYLIPTVLDVPDKVKSVILEYPDPIGPWGARGMAEMPYLPYAPALIAAVEDAIGIRFDEFPLTPERVLKALKAKV
ncbi:MAG: xanthine dehydrogenase family protein [Chloroflexi bacterium]|nr:xanthine dehydrogenase family protein [Chloroflexota bacterium]